MSLRPPELFEGTLSEDELRALSRDIETLCGACEVSVKGAVERRADETHPALEDALDRLVRGAVRGVQLRYRHEGRWWTDTLLRAPGGYRLVRIERPET